MYICYCLYCVHIDRCTLNLPRPTVPGTSPGASPGLPRDFPAMRAPTQQYEYLRVLVVDVVVGS